MPAKSKAQFNFMKAVESGTVKKKGAPSKSVAKEFTAGVTPSTLPAKKTATKTAPKTTTKTPAKKKGAIPPQFLPGYVKKK